VVGARGSGLSTFSAAISSCKSDDEPERRRSALPRLSGDSLRMRLAIGFSVELSGAVRRLVLDSAICGSREGGVTGGRRRSSKGRSEGMSSSIWSREVVD